MRKFSFLNLKRKVSGKTATLLIALILVVTLTVGGTIAYIVATSDSVKNIFNATQVSCEVIPYDDGGYIINTSDIPAHLRAAVVVTWQDDEGKIYGGDVPDAEIKPPLGWVLYNDYYYYASATGMAPGNSGGSFQVTCNEGEPEGYSLSVQIMAEAIQVQGTDEYGNKPIELAWGVDIQNPQTVLPATIEGGAGA